MKSVALPTKQGILYMFDRVTGAPIFPMEERAVEKGDVPGEWCAPFQPVPTKPAAYARNGVTLKDLIDFTPTLKEAGVAAAAQFQLGPLFTPPVGAGRCCVRMTKRPAKKWAAC